MAPLNCLGKSGQRSKNTYRKYRSREVCPVQSDPWCIGGGTCRSWPEIQWYQVCSGLHGHSVPSPVRSPLICSSETSACIAIIKRIWRRGKFGNFTSSSIYLSTKSTLRYLADKEGATDMILWTTHKSHLSLSLAEWRYLGETLRRCKTS